MTRRTLVVALAATLSAHASFAAESCPWLNTATAAGVLGHPVTMTVSRPTKDNDDAVCEFTSETVIPSALRIQVKTMANPMVDFASWLAQCGSNGTPIRGIGNRAVVCSVEKGTGLSEQIVSRVRKRAFLVRVTAKKSPEPLSSLREQLNTVAEMVAGNLF